MTVREMIQKNPAIQSIDIMAPFGYVQCSIKELSEKKVSPHLGCPDTDFDIREWEYEQLMNSKTDKLFVKNNILYGIV